MALSASAFVVFSLLTVSLLDPKTGDLSRSENGAISTKGKRGKPADVSKENFNGKFRVKWHECYLCFSPSFTITSALD